jgi:diaminopropionate ammonia-lyase
MTSWYFSPAAREWRSPQAPADGVREFHRSLPGYAPTPLVSLPELAAELGVGQVLVKDESARMGLAAFKVLGASWACRQLLSQPPQREQVTELVTATDGNHGRAVARMAAHFGLAATVFVPEVMLPETRSRIAGEGADVVEVDGGYDAAVREAASYAAARPERALVQDLAWPGYQRVPAWIVQGYQTLLTEIDDEFAAGGRRPELVVVPVGVGSLAEAVVRHYRRPDGPRPAVLSVEPETAACVLASLSAGRPVVLENTTTVMAGLNCGTVSDSAWPVLRAGCDAAIAVGDDDALRAVEDLRRLGVSSGPSGAASLAGVRVALRDPARRAALGLGPDAVVVLLSTEGQP